MRNPESAKGASLSHSARLALRVSSPQGLSGGWGWGVGDDEKVLEGCRGASGTFCIPLAPAAQDAAATKGRMGLAPLLGSHPEPLAARRGGVRPAGGGARQVTAETRVPGPESQSPRPPRASPTPRAPREPGARHLTMVSGRDDRRAEPPGEGLPFPPTPGEPAPEPRCARSPPCRPSRPLLPFGVFRLLLIVSVYSARVLVVQLEALLAGRRLAVLRHRGGSERLERRRSERQARRDRAGAAAAFSSAAHPRAPECGARGHAHPTGPAHRGRPGPARSLAAPARHRRPARLSRRGPRPHVESPPLQPLARLSRPLPPTSAAMAPPSSPAHFRLFQRVRRRGSRVRASASAAEAPPIPLVCFGGFRPTLPRPPRWRARALSAGAAPPTSANVRARPGLPFPPQSRALRCERGGGARLASRARGRRGWGVACLGLRS